MKMQINIVYCNNDRVIIPCAGMGQHEIQAKLDKLRELPEVLHAWTSLRGR